MQSCRLQWMIAAVAMQVFAAGAAWAAASIDANLEPSQIQMGESARLTILTSGSGTLSVTLPVVAGLEFRVVGQSRQIQFINGASIESTSTIIRVTPDEPGVFTIPGPTPKSPPLVLRVNPGSTSGSLTSSNGGGLTGMLPGGANANGIRMAADGSAFLRLETPKHEIYVGESVPIEIQVGMRDGFVASINGLPKLNNNDFTLNNLSRQPERADKAIDGRPFTVYTWHSNLAAVKPGAYKLTFEAPVTVKIRARPRLDSMLDDLLGDPFMQNFFAATIPKNVTVTSPEAAFTVLPLPAEGKPAGFDGAVGTFKISTDVSAAKTAAGDPLTLRMHVTGAGNFDRVESTMLGADGQWKTYAPKATFTPTDPTGFRGEKIFEQPLIATQPGMRTVPPLSFSYFNPSTRRYETARSAPLNVAVSPAVDFAANEPPAPGPAATAAGTPADDRSGLRPDHAAGEARVDSLIPLYFQPRFLSLPSVLALLFGSGWVALRRRESRAKDLQGARDRARLQITQNLLEQMAVAAAAGDAAVFFNSARSALSQSLSARWRIEPEQVSLAEVETRLEGGDRDDVGEIFSLADEANYSGAHLKATDFERWTEIVRRQAANPTEGNA